MKKVHCFTLIEMLVVIAIISIMAAMLAPALHKARAKAYEISCIGNLKQFGVIVQMYATDCSYLPNCDWDYQFAAYVGGADGLHQLGRCPGAPVKAMDNSKITLTYTIAGVNYNSGSTVIGYARRIAGERDRSFIIRQSRVRHHSYKGIFSEHWNHYLPGSEIKTGKVCPNDRETLFVHINRSCISFLDGHAESGEWKMASTYGASWNTSMMKVKFETGKSKAIFEPYSTVKWR